MSAAPFIFTGNPTATLEEYMFSGGLMTFLWYMIMIYVFFLLLWMVISTVIDIFKRTDMSGLSKAGWLLLIVVLPLIGIMAYVVAKPKYY